MSTSTPGPSLDLQINRKPDSIAVELTRIQELVEALHASHTLHGEIVATLVLPDNQAHIDPKLKILADAWYENYKTLSKRIKGTMKYEADKTDCP